MVDQQARWGRAGGGRWLKYDEYEYEYEYDWLKPKVRCKADR